MRTARLPLALLLVLLPLAPGISRAASAPAAGKPEPQSAGAPARLVLSEVNDRRSRSGGLLVLTLVAPDLSDADVRGQRVVVREATDGTGANLVPEGEGDSTLEVHLGALSSSSRKRPAAFLVQLKSPTRAATSLKLVSGQVEIYVPDRDPASSVTVPKYMSADGRPVNDPALASNGVEVTVLGPKGLAAEKKAAAEAARKKARDEGLSADLVEMEGRHAGERDPVPGYDPKLHTLLKVKDPNGRLGSFGHVDPQGKEEPAWSELGSGYALLTHSAEARGPDWGLRIHLKTPKSLLVRPFVQKDVPLP